MMPGPRSRPRRAPMGVALTDDHRELGEVARAFLTSQKARAAARSLLDAPEEARPPFWHDLVELGWLGLHIDEEDGGCGSGPRLPRGGVRQDRPVGVAARVLAP